LSENFENGPSARLKMCFEIGIFGAKKPENIT
jgi:hypothetical protein